LASSGASSHKSIEEITRYLQSHVQETAETATFITSYDDDAQAVLLHSSRRADAIVLEALLHVDPLNSLSPKIAKGLQASKKDGKWRSTQENCWVLIALNHYFNVFERDEPNLTARSWYGNQLASVHRFQGRSTDTKIVSIPMKYVLETSGESTDIVLQRDGVGRLYYRLGLKYAPRSLDLPNANYGFAVQRTFEGADDPSAVKFVDGQWIFRVGERIRVTLTLATQIRRYHIALVDYLPAGCEALNPALRTTIGEDSEGRRIRPPPAEVFGSHFISPWRSYHWYEHEQLRDERAEVFSSVLYPGVYEWAYYIRATATGNFIVPPAKAEEMYSPEIFGRTATAHVSVQ
jgi:uncharacterized protein YfaS (alpha-2-macroglobulin family)